MALTTATIRAGIATQIETVDLRAYSYNTDAPQPPCAVVLFPASITPAAMGDAWDYSIPVQVMVQRITDARSQERLDSLLSSLSDALEGDTFAWGSSQVTGIDGIGDTGTDQGAMTVATITLMVRA